MASENYLLGFLNPFFKERWGNGTPIDIEERDVVVGNLVKKNDELHEIGVCLLPEGFFAAAEKVVQK